MISYCYLIFIFFALYIIYVYLCICTHKTQYINIIFVISISYLSHSFSKLAIFLCTYPVVPISVVHVSRRRSNNNERKTWREEAASITWNLKKKNIAIKKSRPRVIATSNDWKLLPVAGLLVFTLAWTSPCPCFKQEKQQQQEKDLKRKKKHR